MNWKVIEEPGEEVLLDISPQACESFQEPMKVILGSFARTVLLVTSEDDTSEGGGKLWTNADAVFVTVVLACVVVIVLIGTWTDTVIRGGITVVVEGFGAGAVSVTGGGALAVTVTSAGVGGVTTTVGVSGVGAVTVEKLDETSQIKLKSKTSRNIHDLGAIMSKQQR